MIYLSCDPFPVMDGGNRVEGSKSPLVGQAILAFFRLEVRLMDNRICDRIGTKLIWILMHDVIFAAEFDQAWT